jgi:hypothetical protein
MAEMVVPNWSSKPSAVRCRGVIVIAALLISRAISATSSADAKLRRVTSIDDGLWPRIRWRLKTSPPFVRKDLATYSR